MDAAARPDLAATWERVAVLAEQRGADPREVLDVERLGHLSGVEPALIPAVLAGAAPAVPLCVRVHRRFRWLRATRRDRQGREWPLAAIAEDFDAPGASLGPLNAGTGLPRLRHAAGVQRFFGVYAGFLLADSRSAVERAVAAVASSTCPGATVPAAPPGSAAGLVSGSGGTDDLDLLSHLTGMPPHAVAQTLDGRPPRLPLSEQVHQRFAHLRRTRLRPDGQPHSLDAIARSFDASGQSLTRLARGEGLPSLAAAAGIQRFYGVDSGFLLADDTEALGAALADIEHGLLVSGGDAANPMLGALRAHDVRGIVARAGRLSAAGRQSLRDHLDDLLAREGRLGIPGARGEGPARTVRGREDAAEGGVP
ncbi:hypothetical protein SUDANB120_05159 [Streptomyces sp. enrichment culture]|uniref:hypothetical protein n=1 Tax=Streptomyces TaxID=1883 RepID=UPI0016724167|nr:MULTISPECIES: hypothetical protein [Streptomyces]MBD3576309.1 hypothetical protein [Streptomyces sp. KD18]GGT12264.1 hypothetical protein GCM10010286_42390 [Streptomyces toxytricini]